MRLPALVATTILAALLAAPTVVHADSTASTTQPTVMVEAPSPKAAERIAAEHGLTVSRGFAWIGWYELATPEGTASAAAAQRALDADTDVARTDAVRPGEDLGFAFTPRDPFWQGNMNTDSGALNGQWHLTKANFPAAFDMAKGTGVQIGIIDSEFFTDHPDLSAKIRNPRNFANGTPGYGSGDVKAENDNQMHGTHVAGIAAASTDNGLGGSGAGFDATIVPAKVRTNFTPGGGASIDAGFVADVVEAIGYMATQNVAVVNMSLGGTRDHPPIAAAIAALRARGITVVVAAGNNQQSDPNAPIYPASYPGAFAVANTRADNTINPTSSNGSWVDIAAPGTDILSTWDSRSARQESFPVNGEGNSRYGIISGTSMAAPVVTGLVALIKSVRPDLSPDEVEAVITSTATDLGSPGPDPQFGAGLIDANRAVAAAIAYVRPTPPPAPVPQPPAPAPDTTAPGLRIRGTAKLDRRRRKVTVRVQCDEACTGTLRLYAAKGTRKKGKRYASKRFSGTPNRAVTVKLSSSARLRRKARVILQVKAKDRAGNTRTQEFRTRLR